MIKQAIIIGCLAVAGAAQARQQHLAHVEVDVRRHKASPRWMYSDTWDLVQVTRRGVDAPMERVCLGTQVSGTLLLIR